MYHYIFIFLQLNNNTKIHTKTSFRSVQIIEEMFHDNGQIHFHEKNHCNLILTFNFAIVSNKVKVAEFGSFPIA